MTFVNFRGYLKITNNRMLSIEPSKNAESAVRYFRESLSVEDYYSEKAEITGRWHGKGSERLGISGEVRKRDFEALLFNVNPKTGDRLTARNSVNRRPMYDFTFSAPKSVSVAYAMTRNGEILEAHRLATLMAMEAVERDVQTQVGTGKAKHYVGTGNIMFAEFIHETSRPLEHEKEAGKLYIPDPQLHTHMTVINATFFTDQNRWRAVELGNVKAHGDYYESIYHSYLGKYLKDAGYALEKEGKRWELACVPKGVRDKYSGRTIEIEKEAERLGVKTARTKALLGRRTRNDKNKSVLDSELPGIWKDRLSLSEYYSIVNAKKASGRQGENVNLQNPHLALEKAVDLALAHRLERQSAAAEKKVLSFANDLTSGDFLPHEVQAELDGRQNIIGTDRRTVKFITTREILQEEEKLIERSAFGKSTKVSINPDYQFKSKVLNDGQKEAIRHVLESGDQIIMISGDAGTGKTTLLKEVKIGIEEAGCKLFAFAPTSDASRGQLQNKGFEGAETIAKLLADQKLQNQMINQYMLVDESGLVSVPQMNQILDVAEAQNCRVILSGDYKQHSSVERGDATRIMETHAGLPVARVKEIVRQREQEAYKKVIEAIAQGIAIKGDPDRRVDEVQCAFDKLDQTGSINEVENLEERHEQIANDYVLATENSTQDAILVAPTHGEGKDITEVIRQKLKETGRLSGEERTFKRLQSLHLTESEKQLEAYYEAGHVVEFHQNVPGFKAGTRQVVEGKDQNGQVLVKPNDIATPASLPMEEHKKFQLFKEEPLNLSVGDRIRITKNIKSVEGHHLSNGQVYDLKSFSDDGHIMLSNGQTLHKDAGHFNSGYYQTSYAAQGKDAKTVIVAQSSRSFGASSDKQFYVSISRGVEDCRIYTDDKEALREAIARPGDRPSAMELASEADRQKSESQSHSQYQRLVRQFYDQQIQPSQKTIEPNHGRRKPDEPMERPGFNHEK